MNENTIQPAMPEGVEEGIIKGMYQLDKHEGDTQVNLLGSGTILQEVMAAAKWLAENGIGSKVHSVTSFNELARTHAHGARKAKLDGELIVDTFKKRCLIM